MLKALLSYSTTAFAVQVVTGGLTFLVEMLVAGTLGRDGLGRYGYFILIMEMWTGFVIAGMDHALIIYVNKEEANYSRFLRLFLTFGTILFLAGSLAALLLSPWLDLDETLAVLMIAPFVIFTLGTLTLRARLDKRREFGLLLFQSLVWSLGTMVTILFVESDFVPIAWSILARGMAAAAAFIMFFRVLAARGESPVCRHPFSVDYRDLWLNYRPLWLAGLAFTANAKAVELIIKQTLDGASGGFAYLGGWYFVLSIQRFIEKPFQLIRRATLPLFSRPDEDIDAGFRSMTRMTLLAFPLLVIAILAAFPVGIAIGRLDEYSDTWPFLAVILVVTPVKIVEFLVSTACMAKGFARSNRNAHALTVLFNIPVAYLLITRFGLMGAALAGAAHVVIFAALMLGFGYRHLPHLIRFGLRHLTISTVTLGIAVGMMEALGRTWWSGAPAVVIYLALTRMMGLWTGEHLRRGRDLVFPRPSRRGD